MMREGREFLEQQARAGRNGTGGSGDGGEWSKLWQVHGEGGGPFGGRDNALTKLVGFFRAKSYPYDGALEMAHMWNERFCNPPLSGADIHEKVGRAWAMWAEGGHDDLTPDDLKPKKQEAQVLEFKTTDDLLDLDASGCGMEWLVPNVLVKGGVHFLSAPAAGSKTFVMIDLARCVAGGEKWFDTIAVVKGAVLYVDEEMGEQKMSSRVRKLGVARGLPIYYLGKQGITISDPACRKQIVDFCTEKGVVLVILDTLTGVMPGLRENEAEHVSRLRRYFQDLTQGGMALLVAHHDRKGGKGEGSVEHERMAGSRDFAAMADMAYSIDKKGDFYHLSCPKNRLLPDDEALSIDYCLQDNEDHSLVSVVVVDAEAKTEKYQAALAMKIGRALLNSEGMDTAQITEVVKVTKATVTDAVKKMVADGALAMRKEGKRNVYTLPEETPF